MTQTNPRGRIAAQHAAPQPAPSARLPAQWIGATGGHEDYRDDAPQSVTQLRNQFEAAPPGTAFDLGGRVWHLRNQQLAVHDHVERIRNGVFLIEPTDGGRAGILIRGRTRPLIIEDCTMLTIGDPSVNQEAAIYSYESRAPLTIRSCTFAGAPRDPLLYHRRGLTEYQPMPTGRAISARSSATAEGGGITVESCAVLAADERHMTHGRGTPCMEFSGTLLGNQRDHYRTHKTPVGVRQWYRDVIVKSCEITGGYYGVSTNAVDNVLIEGNMINGQMRCISLQNSTTDGIVRRNWLHDFRSTAVHLAYGCANVSITANTAASSVVEGQAMIQAYCSCSNVTMARNTTVTTGAAIGPWVYMYAGNGCQHVTIVDNRCNGPVRGGMLGIDQSWALSGDVVPTYTHHYPADEELGVHAPSVGHSVAGNVRLLSDPLPVLVLSNTTASLEVAAGQPTSAQHNGGQVDITDYPALFTAQQDNNKKYDI